MTGSPPPPPGIDGERYLAENEDRLSWIMGSSRSGSTWLLEMLTEPTGVAGIDDPHLGHHLGVWRPLPLAWAASEERPELRTLADLKGDKPGYFFSERYRDAWIPGLRQLVRARFGAQLEDELPATAADPRVVVKEPGSQAAELLLSALPRSRLIFLLRDGRDVVDSWLDAYQRGSWAIDEGAFPAADHGRLALVEWLSSVWSYRTEAVGRAYERHQPSRRCLVRYESLLRDPRTELERAFAAIGVEIASETVDEIAGRSSYELVSPGSRGSHRRVRAASPGAWRDNLDRDEQRAMHAVMGTQLSAWGYLETDDAGSVAA